MTILFSNNFETGVFSPFTTQTIGTGAVAQIVSIVPFNGSNHARFSIPGLLPDFEMAHGYVLVDDAPNTQVNVGAEVRVSTYPTNTVFIMGIADIAVGAKPQCWVGLNANGTLRLRTYDGVSYNSINSSVIILPLNEYHFIELQMNRVVGGGATLYFDGNPILNLIANLAVISPQAGVGFGVESLFNNVVPATVDMDAVSVANAYIGPPSEQAQPKISVNSISPSGADMKVNVLIDGTPVGLTPLVGYTIAAGRHVVRVDEIIVR